MARLGVEVSLGSASQAAPVDSWKGVLEQNAFKKEWLSHWRELEAASDDHGETGIQPSSHVAHVNRDEGSDAEEQLWTPLEQEDHQQFGSNLRAQLDNFGKDDALSSHWASLTKKFGTKIKHVAKLQQFQQVSELVKTLHLFHTGEHICERLQNNVEHFDRHAQSSRYKRLSEDIRQSKGVLDYIDKLVDQEHGQRFDCLHYMLVTAIKAATSCQTHAEEIQTCESHWEMDSHCISHLQEKYNSIHIKLRQCKGASFDTLKKLLRHAHSLHSAIMLEIEALKAERISRHTMHRAFMEEVEEQNRKYKHVYAMVQEYEDKAAQREQEHRMKLNGLKQKFGDLRRIKTSLEKKCEDEGLRSEEVWSRLEPKMEKHMTQKREQMLLLHERRRHREHSYQKSTLVFKKAAYEREITELEEKLSERKQEVARMEANKSVLDLRLHILKARSLRQELRLRAQELTLDNTIADDNEAALSSPNETSAALPVGFLRVLANELHLQRRWLTENGQPWDFSSATLSLLCEPLLATPMSLLRVPRLMIERQNKKAYIVGKFTQTKAKRVNRVTEAAKTQFRLLLEKRRQWSALSMADRCAQAVDYVLRREYPEFIEKTAAPVTQAIAPDVERMMLISDVRCTEELSDMLDKLTVRWSSCRGVDLFQHFPNAEHIVAQTDAILQDLHTAFNILQNSLHWFTDSAGCTGAFCDMVQGDISWLPFLAQRMCEQLGILRAVVQILEELQHKEDVEQIQISLLSQEITQLLDQICPLVDDTTWHHAESLMLRLQDCIRKQLYLHESCISALHGYCEKVQRQRNPEFNSVYTALDALQCVLDTPQLRGPTGALCRATACEVNDLTLQALGRLLKLDPEALEFAIIALGAIVASCRNEHIGLARASADDSEILGDESADIISIASCAGQIPPHPLESSVFSDSIACNLDATLSTCTPSSVMRSTLNWTGLQSLENETVDPLNMTDGLLTDLREVASPHGDAHVHDRGLEDNAALARIVIMHLLSKLGATLPQARHSELDTAEQPRLHQHGTEENVSHPPSSSNSKKKTGEWSSSLRRGVLVAQASFGLLESIGQGPDKQVQRRHSRGGGPRWVRASLKTRSAHDDSTTAVSDITHAHRSSLKAVETPRLLFLDAISHVQLKPAHNSTQVAGCHTKAEKEGDKQNDRTKSLFSGRAFENKVSKSPSEFAATLQAKHWQKCKVLLNPKGRDATLLKDIEACEELSAFDMQAKTYGKDHCPDLNEWLGSLLQVAPKVEPPNAGTWLTDSIMDTSPEVDMQLQSHEVPEAKRRQSSIAHATPGKAVVEGRLIQLPAAQERSKRQLLSDEPPQQHSSLEETKASLNRVLQRRNPAWVAALTTKYMKDLVHPSGKNDLLPLNAATHLQRHDAETNPRLIENHTHQVTSSLALSSFGYSTAPAARATAMESHDPMDHDRDYDHDHNQRFAGQHMPSKQRRKEAVPSSGEEGFPQMNRAACAQGHDAETKSCAIDSSQRQGISNPAIPSLGHCAALSSHTSLFQKHELMDPNRRLAGQTMPSQHGCQSRAENSTKYKKERRNVEAKLSAVEHLNAGGTCSPILPSSGRAARISEHHAPSQQQTPAWLAELSTKDIKQLVHPCGVTHSLPVGRVAEKKWCSVEHLHGKGTCPATVPSSGSSAVVAPHATLSKNHEPMDPGQMHFEQQLPTSVFAGVETSCLLPSGYVSGIPRARVGQNILDIASSSATGARAFPGYVLRKINPDSAGCSKQRTCT